MFNSVAGGIRDQIWAGMERLFRKYAEGSNYITPRQIQRVLVEVMGRADPSEIDYVMKNLFRLDTDDSGDVDFPQFANYILKRYCGELSLQEMHKQGQLSRGQDYLINQREFITLLNRAYRFLGVSVDQTTATHIFKEADQNKDGYITYPEYFNFIKAYICEANPNFQIKAPTFKAPIRKYTSRIRQFFWKHLRNLFVKYDANKDGLLQVNEIENLAKEILGSKKKGEFEYIVYTVFQIRREQNASINFEDFTSRFLAYVIELHLSKLSQTHQTKRLSQSEFVETLKLAFSFLPFNNPEFFFGKFYQVLDHEKSGNVGFEQVNHWVKNFLSPVQLQTDEYYLPQDDSNDSSGRNFIVQSGTPPSLTVIPPSTTSPPISPNPTRTQPLKPLQPLQFSSPARSSSSQKISSNETLTKRFNLQQTVKEVKFNKQQTVVTISVKCPFTFTSNSLANAVRKQILHILAEYDANNNKEFEENEIIDILQTVMKEDKNEVRYVIANVFRYDKNGDKIVTYDELANFFLECHCGEMAIQRLHRRNAYKMGAQRVMNLQQFIITLNYALSFISITPTEQDLTSVFRDIDRNKDGLISYQQYFEFLRYYFGSESYAAQTGGEDIPLPEVKPKQPTGIAEERFSKLIRAQARVLFMNYDLNKNVLFERDEVAQLISNLLKHNPQQKTFTMDQLYKSSTSGLNYDSFNGHLLQIHFSDIFLKRNISRFSQGQSQLINKSQFIDLVQQSCHFIPVKSEPEQLEVIFANIDANNDGLISFYEYVEFVKRWLGSRSVVHPPIQNFKPFWATGLSGVTTSATHPIR